MTLSQNGILYEESRRYTWNDAQHVLKFAGRVTAAAPAASGGQADLNVYELHRARPLEEGLKGLDGAVGAAVPITRLVLTNKVRDFK